MAKKRKIKPFRILLLISILILGIEFISNLMERLFYHEPEPIVIKTPEPNVDPVYKHDYDFSKFYKDGYLRYDDEQYTSDVGIDVSHYQKDIDWTKVKESGVSFVIIQAGYRGYESGILHENERYRSYIQGALDAGLEVGVYFFSQAIDREEAMEEARFVLKLVKDYEIHCGIAFDMEYVGDYDRIHHLTKEEITQITHSFSETIREAGYTPIIYGSASWLENQLYMEYFQDDCEFWVASFQEEKEPYEYIYSIWQYTEKGIVPGIDHPVDLNIRIKKK